MKRIAALIDSLWCGDVSYEEATEDLTDKDIQELESHLEEHWDAYRKGIPFLNEIDVSIKESRGFSILQSIVGKIE